MAVVPIDKLIPHPKNPRIDLKPGMPMYDKLAKSIEEHSYIDPIIWNETTGHIIAGHQRLQVMKDLSELDGESLEKVKVIVVNLPEEKELTFMVADNKITGIWDQEKLASLMKELEETDTDLALTGFDDFEIQALIGDISPETYSDEGMEDYVENAEGQLKSYNVILSCMNEDEQAWVKQLIHEEDRLKRGYKVSELMERIS